MLKGESLEGMNNLLEESDRQNNCVESEASPLSDMDAAYSEPVDFENNGLLWFPPEPENEEDEIEAFLSDDGDEGVDSLPGEWGHLRSSSSSIGAENQRRDRSIEEHRTPGLTVIGHEINNNHEEVGSKEEFPPSPSDHQSILVSLTTRCVWKGTVCERAHLFRIEYYGSLDKPLGRFLRDHLFDQSFHCRSCEMPSEAHIHCYTHQQGSLTISVKKLPEILLPGNREGKIWMWHRCLRCPRTSGFPPSTRRVVMSDAAWGLSFGKFLELSFSNHAAASSIASCCHSVPRDCLRFYGFGRMVACLRFAPIVVNSVYLPPAKLEFDYDSQYWIQKEADEVRTWGDHLFDEVLKALHQVLKGCSIDNGTKTSEFGRLISELEGIRRVEKEEFEESLCRVLHMKVKVGQPAVDILEINRLKRELIFLSYIWDQRLIHIHNLSNTNDPVISCLSPKFTIKPVSSSEKPNETDATASSGKGSSSCDSFFSNVKPDTTYIHGVHTQYGSHDGVHKGMHIGQILFGGEQFNLGEDKPVYMSSFQELVHQGGGRLLLPVGINHTVVPVYDNEPASIISYALASTNYHFITSNAHERSEAVLESPSSLPIVDSDNLLSPPPLDETSSETARSLKSFHKSDSLTSVPQGSDLEPIFYANDPHAGVSFEDDGPPGKVKYIVTCYYAKRFEALRRICCPSELDYVRSLSRCEKWDEQGGKNIVYFAKTLDDKFIIKQVSKAELKSFIKFAPSYFKYLSDSISDGSPTCLAKILGIYQITSKQLKGGKETKMDVLVVENLLYRRSITKLYDLKGSPSRHNPVSSGSNGVVLLDQNLIETVQTSPIFWGSNSKRLLERAVWNDTAFLASVDVMDYSLLVGIDEEKHELVVGIISFIRQYTWDKHLQNWVQTFCTSCLPKNVSPTLIPPNSYKKRLRNAVTTYFSTLPDQYPPSE